MQTARALKLSKDQEERANALHKASIVISGLDSLSEKGYTDTRLYLQNMKAGGITAQNISVGSGIRGPELVSSVRLMNKWHGIIENNSDLALHVRSADDVQKAKQSGKAGVIFGFQDGDPIGRDLEFLSFFRRFGLGVMGLCYQRKNFIGDGCGERTDCGLSTFGVQVIEEMNRIGLLVDLCHVGRKTSLEAIETSKEPVIFSHTNTRSLCDFNYNATDEMIKAMAEKGGVIGLTPVSQYLTSKGAMEGSSIDDYLDHIDYVVNLVGVDHAGIGLDLFEGESRLESERADERWPEMFNRPYVLEKKHPIGFQKVVDVPNVTKGLVSRGYTDLDIKKIIGGNFLRVFGKVWK